jgi:hypothetical protein
MAAADRHKNPLVVGIRGADERLRDEARAAAVAAGYPDLSAATVAYWSWLTRRSGATSPRRPEAPAAVARQLLAELAAMLGTGGLDPADRSQILAGVSSLQADCQTSR